MTALILDRIRNTLKEYDNDNFLKFENCHGVSGDDVAELEQISHHPLPSVFIHWLRLFDMKDSVAPIKMFGLENSFRAMVDDYRARLEKPLIFQRRFTSPPESFDFSSYLILSSYEKQFFHYVMLDLVTGAVVYFNFFDLSGTAPPQFFILALDFTSYIEAMAVAIETNLISYDVYAEEHFGRAHGTDHLFLMPALFNLFVDTESHFETCNQMYNDFADRVAFNPESISDLAKIESSNSVRERLNYFTKRFSALAPIPTLCATSADALIPSCLQWVLPKPADGPKHSGQARADPLGFGFSHGDEEPLNEFEQELNVELSANGKRAAGKADFLSISTSPLTFSDYENQYFELLLESGDILFGVSLKALDGSREETVLFGRKTLIHMFGSTVAGTTENHPPFFCHGDHLGLVYNKSEHNLEFFVNRIFQGYVSLSSVFPQNEIETLAFTAELSYDAEGNSPSVLIVSE